MINIDLNVHPYQSTINLQELNLRFMLQITEMLHQLSLYLQTFQSLKKHVEENQASRPYQMAFHANWCPDYKYTRWLHDPTCSDVANLFRVVEMNRAED